MPGAALLGLNHGGVGLDGRADVIGPVTDHDHDALGLKPSMRCIGEIVLGEVEDVISVPIQAVYREGAQSFVYVPGNGGYVPTPVALGRSSEMVIEITDGLAEGEQVLLRRPKIGEVRGELPELASGKNRKRPGPPANVGAEEEKTTASDPSEEGETNGTVFNRRHDGPVRTSEARSG